MAHIIPILKNDNSVPPIFKYFEMFRSWWNFLHNFVSRIPRGIHGGLSIFDMVHILEVLPFRSLVIIVDFGIVNAKFSIVNFTFLKFFKHYGLNVPKNHEICSSP